MQKEPPNSMRGEWTDSHIPRPRHRLTDHCYVELLHLTYPIGACTVTPPRVLHHDCPGTLAGDGPIVLCECPRHPGGGK